MTGRNADHYTTSNEETFFEQTYAKTSNPEVDLKTEFELLSFVHPLQEQEEYNTPAALLDYLLGRICDKMGSSYEACSLIKYLNGK